MKPYSENNVNRKTSSESELFASLVKAVDKFHFPGHKRSDKYCQENCNPKRELEKLGMTNVNTPACEQAFKWINAFKSMKSMNESHFKFFLLYLINLHNLHIEGSLSRVVNPHNPKRDLEIIMHNVASL